MAFLEREFVREFLFRPLSITRITALICATIVFSSIMAGGFNPWTNRCIYHDDEACLYGLCTGMVGAAICLSNLFCDARLHRIIMIDTRQKVIQMDIILSCAMSIVCFAGFCLLANVYFTNKVHESSSDEYLEENSVLAIVFSGLSVFPWVALVIQGVRRYREFLQETRILSERPYRFSKLLNKDEDLEGFYPRPFNDKSSVQ